jgi:hypothetical protein
MEAACTMVHNHCRRTGVVRDGQVAGIIREQHLFFELERVLPQRRPTTPARKRLSLAPVPFPGPFRVFNGSAPILSHTHPGILNFFLSTIRIAAVLPKASDAVDAVDAVSSAIPKGFPIWHLKMT